MAFTRRFNQVSNPLHVPVQRAALPPAACWGSVPNTWPQVQTPLPEPPLSFILGPSQSSFLPAGGTEHTFLCLNQLPWFPIPHKLRFKHLNWWVWLCPPASLISCPSPYSAGFSHSGLPSFPNADTSVPSGFQACCLLSSEFFLSLNGTSWGVFHEPQPVEVSPSCIPSLHLCFSMCPHSPVLVLCDSAVSSFLTCRWAP